MRLGSVLNDGTGAFRAVNQSTGTGDGPWRCSGLPLPDSATIRACSLSAGALAHQLENATMERTDTFSESRDIRRLMIFGHPTHELALFGAIQRLDPHILVITQGDGPTQEGYSRTALGRIDRLGRTTYLGYHEADFYQALLDGDTGYFDRVVADIRDEVDRVRPDQVFCDAIEFYNPVHDITLVLVEAALDGAEAAVYGVPLVYQKDEGDEAYEIQRVPDPLADRRRTFELNDAELERKREARNEIYLNLRDQAGGDFMGLGDSHLVREEVEALNGIDLRPGADGRRMRYEWRADVLQREGAIDRKITYREHYLPMVEHYVGG
jgi:hypothetical protein